MFLTLLVNGLGTKSRSLFSKMELFQNRTTGLRSIPLPRLLMELPETCIWWPQNWHVVALASRRLGRIFRRDAACCVSYGHRTRVLSPEPILTG